MRYNGIYIFFFIIRSTLFLFYRKKLEPQWRPSLLSALSWSWVRFLIWFNIHSHLYRYRLNSYIKRTNLVWNRPMSLPYRSSGMCLLKYCKGDSKNFPLQQIQISHYMSYIILLPIDNLIIPTQLGRCTPTHDFPVKTWTRLSCITYFYLSKDFQFKKIIRMV